MNFYEKMRIVCMAIPKGKVATYGQIALLCGKPKNSRQVGYGLKKNLAGEDVPAYRVVNGKGDLSGACHFEFAGLQKMMLEEENIELTWNGNNWGVDLKKYRWNNSLKEAELFRQQFLLEDMRNDYTT